MDFLALEGNQVVRRIDQYGTIFRINARILISVVRHQVLIEGLLNYSDMKGNVVN